MSFFDAADDDELEKEAWEESLKGSRRAKSGIDLKLEEEADRILADARRGTTKHSEMNDYLSNSQIARRLSREILPSSGIPDPSIVSGLFRRTYMEGKEKGPRDKSGNETRVFPVTVRKISEDD